MLFAEDFPDQATDQISIHCTTKKALGYNNSQTCHIQRLIGARAVM